MQRVSQSCLFKGMVRPYYTPVNYSWFIMPTINLMFTGTAEKYIYYNEQNLSTCCVHCEV